MIVTFIESLVGTMIWFGLFVRKAFSLPDTKLANAFRIVTFVTTVLSVFVTFSLVGFIIVITTIKATLFDSSWQYWILLVSVMFSVYSLSIFTINKLFSNWNENNIFDTVKYYSGLGAVLLATAVSFSIWFFTKADVPDAGKVVTDSPAYYIVFIVVPLLVNRSAEAVARTANK